jgi:hypothetical protein
MARTHWSSPDIAAVILAEALRPGTARPVAVHVRPEVHRLLRRQVSTAPLAVGAAADRWNGIRLVVDDQIPACPGYEIHRAVAPVTDRLAPRRPTDPGVSPSAGEPLAA